jgi:hypothetical protein
MYKKSRKMQSCAFKVCMYANMHTYIHTYMHTLCEMSVSANMKKIFFYSWSCVHVHADVYTCTTIHMHACMHMHYNNYAHICPIRQTYKKHGQLGRSR